MKKAEIREYIEDKKYIHTRMIFEIVGNPKEHVEKTLTVIIEQLEKDKDLKIVDKETEPAEELEEKGLFSAFCEAELLVKDVYKLSWLIFNLTPASIEILEPSKLNLTQKQTNEFFMDLLGKLHENNQRQVEVSSKNIGLQKSLNRMIRNAVLLTTDKETLKSADEIGKKVGIEGKDLKPILELMIKEKTLKKEGEDYKRA